MAQSSNIGPNNSSHPIDISSANSFRKKATKEEDIFSEQDLELRELQKRYNILNSTQDEIFEHVKEYIKGQDDALKTLIFIIYNNHYLNMLEDTNGIVVKHISGLVIGPSGSGKSASIERIAKTFGIPYTRINSTNLTASGYVGGDVDNIILTHIKNAGGNIEKAERGIIFIDEIDKKVSAPANNTSGKDINGTSIQEELLKILEPSIITVGKDNVPFDTHMLTVICGGCFNGIEKIRDERLNGKKTIGFSNKVIGKSVHSCDDEDDDDFLAKAIDEDTSPEYIKKDVIKFGFISEFAGRFLYIAEFKKLTPDIVEDIIYAKGSVLQQYLNVFYSRGVELIIDPIIFTQIAQSVANSETGARDIESKVLKVLAPALRDVEQNYCPGICEIDGNLNYTSLFQKRGSDEIKVNVVTAFANRTDIKPSE